ncbi:hypothetical protein BV25DRAFT_1090811 [Artomyces pyxidatus]|uniref:Uncharacterized protein n=1 Tax=Artomyces pyxidatus TaxID=48021 RepID=A0ACB8TG23_9AGAM|nr:hypothetical protein BV25DRAFT_1090811 [Artomyces pyxidatus]
MATPSSSTTTPSPPMAFLQARPLPPSALTFKGQIDAEDREDRQRAVDKFLARAEISQLTRGLRARLSWATYKATHNMSRASLGDVESHAPADIASGTWASARNNYYDNPATQGNSAMAASLGGSQRRGSMAPPTAIPSSGSRTHHGQPHGKEPSTANATQSLYASILTAPPAKRARTIHNADDPPLQAPAKMANGTPRQRKGSHTSESSRHSRTGSGSQSFSSVAERTRAQAKRKDEPTKRKGSRKNKSKRVGASPASAEHDTDIDMKAAATLTELLRHSRSSITVGATSPRSSISAGSDVGSAQSLSQFAQSSTRTTTAQTTLVESSFMSPNARPVTPPRALDLRTQSNAGSQAGSDAGSGPATATDQEAVKLLYFLHESPSPARPSTHRSRDAHDAAAFRTLGGGDLKAKGRILFPSPSASLSEAMFTQRMLARDNSGSMTSTTSTALTESPSARPLVRDATLRVDPPVGDVVLPHRGESPGEDVGVLDASSATHIIPPTPTAASPTSQLLPPPPSPHPRPALPASPQNDHKVHLAQPVTPGTFTFNMNDFINVSPSPAAIPSRGFGSKAMLPGLRGVTTGRKLFQEEQADPMMGMQDDSGGGEVGGNATLGAGIHLSHF